MKPAAFEALAGCGRVFQVALHHHIAAEHDLADGLPVPGHRVHGLRIAHRQILQNGVVDALPGLDRGLLPGGQAVPFVMPCVDDGGTVGLRQAVDVDDFKAGFLHGLERRCGRRRGGGEERDAVAVRLALLLRRVDEQAHDDRCAAHVGDAVSRAGIENAAGFHAAQADVHAGHHAERPGEAPAVAMEHGQGPEVDRMLRHAGGHDIAHGQEIGAAMVVDDALGVAGGS